MKKIICSIDLFDLYQEIQIADTDLGEVKVVAKVPRDDLEETLAAISYQYKIPQIIITGHPFGNKIAEEILEYANTNYSDFKVEVEVL